MVKRLKIAIVGLGGTGKRHVHTLIGRVPRANVLAVCSDQPHEIAWTKENYADEEIGFYNSYDATLKHPGLEAVWISSLIDVHASQALEGIKEGLHFLCEKPLSTDPEESYRPKGLSMPPMRNPQLNVMAEFCRYFDASYRDAKNKIANENAISQPFVVSD